MGCGSSKVSDAPPPGTGEPAYYAEEAPAPRRVVTGELVGEAYGEEGSPEPEMEG